MRTVSLRPSLNDELKEPSLPSPPRLLSVVTWINVPVFRRKHHIAGSPRTIWTEWRHKERRTRWGLCYENYIKHEVNDSHEYVISRNNVSSSCNMRDLPQFALSDLWYLTYFIFKWSLPTHIRPTVLLAYVSVGVAWLSYGPTYILVGHRPTAAARGTYHATFEQTQRTGRGQPQYSWVSTADMDKVQLLFTKQATALTLPKYSPPHSCCCKHTGPIYSNTAYSSEGRSKA